MGWEAALRNFFQSLGGAPQVQPINPNTAPGQAPTLATGGTAGSGASASAPSTSSPVGPWAQAALATYLGAVGSPRLAGRGGMISRGGLAGLGAFTNAEAQQSAQAKAQQEAAQAQQEMALKQGQFKLDQQKFTAEQQKQQDVLATNQNTGTLFVQGHPNDPTAALLGNAAMKNNQKLVDPAELEKALNDAKAAPAKLNEINQQIATGKAAATKDLAEAGKADRDTGGIKPKLETIYGPGGATKEVSVSAGYTPPAGWSIGKPSAAGKSPDALLNLSRLHAVYDKEYGGTSGAIGSFVSRTMGGTGRPSFEDYAVTSGIDPISGTRLPKLPTDSAGYKYDPSIGHAVAVDKDGNVTHVFDARVP